MALCELCGEPMPEGEEMFKFHGYSGNCPKPPKGPKEIKFYSRKGPCEFLSNFDRRPVCIDEQVWPSREHYYQAMKFTSPEIQEKIRLAEKPSIAKTMGQDRTNTIRTDWEEVKEVYMLKALLATVLQDKEIAQKLRETGDAILIEDSPTDYYWGCGTTGKGLNRLGKLWMYVRDCIMSKQPSI